MTGPDFPLEPFLLTTVINQDQSLKEAGKSRGLSLALFRAWPSPSDLDYIHNISTNTSGSSGKVYTHHACFLGQDEPSPRDMLQYPPMGLHPVLMARKFLTLGTYMQGVAGLDARYRDMMSDMVETATRLVTSNDELVCSLEGVECIMIESLYHHNAGNLHRAWLAARRAMMVAQIIGLYRRPKWSSLKVLDPEARERISSGSLWFRVVHADRYFSLMLGLPQGSSENSFATPMALESCSPFERLERMAAVVAGRILQIRDTKLRDFDTTHKVDELLLEASESMPTEWWPTPDLASDENTTVRKAIRIMGQVMHFNLQAHLHLPYILDSSDDPKYDYNRITAAHASRELLLRFVCCGSNDVTIFHCSGLSFHAFIAGTALCLAHVYAHRRLIDGDGNNSSSSSVHRCLTRRRCNDRDMIQRVLESAEHMAGINTNPTASKIATVLKHLLAIEAESASGISYNTSFNRGAEGEKLEYGGEVDDSTGALHIHLPHFGIIKVERSNFPASISGDPSLPKEDASSTADPELCGLDTSFLDFPLPLGQLGQYGRQSPIAQSDQTGGRNENMTSNPSEQAISTQFERRMQPEQRIAPAASNNDVFTFTSGAFHNTQLLSSGPTVSMDELTQPDALITAYDSLGQEKAISDVADEENWMW